MPKYECADTDTIAAATILIADCDELSHLKQYHLRYFLAIDWKGKKEWIHGEVKTVTNIAALLMRDQLKPGMPAEDPADWVTYAIFLNKRMWKALKTDEEREVVLYPLLYSLQQRENGDGLSIEEPDINLFKQQVARFGCALPDVRKLLEMVDSGGQGELSLVTTGDEDDTDVEDEQ